MEHQHVNTKYHQSFVKYSITSLKTSENLGIMEKLGSESQQCMARIVYKIMVKPYLIISTAQGCNLQVLNNRKVGFGSTTKE